MAYTTSWVGATPQIGMVNLQDLSTNPGLGTPGNAALPSSILAPQFGTIIAGWEPNLGGGEFIYLKGVASLVAGDVVSYNAFTGVTVRWAGTANTGSPLAIAISAPTATQNGWFQISGNAIANVSGTVAAGDAAFFNATAQLKTASVNGKQVNNCVAALANGGTVVTGSALAAGLAVYTIQRPFAQGIIT